MTRAIPEVAAVRITSDSTDINGSNLFRGPAELGVGTIMIALQPLYGVCRFQDAEMRSAEAWRAWKRHVFDHALRKRNGTRESHHSVRVLQKSLAGMGTFCRTGDRDVTSEVHSTSHQIRPPLSRQRIPIQSMFIVKAVKVDEDTVDIPVCDVTWCDHRGHAHGDRAMLSLVPEAR